MLHNIRKYGLVFLSVLMLLFPFVFYSSDLTSHRELSVVEKIMYSIIHPIELSTHWILYNTKNFNNKYVDMRQIKDNLEALKKDNTKLQLELQVVREMHAENTRLRQLLGLAEHAGLKFKSCEVVSFDPSFLFRNVRIGCGESDGIIAGMGVVAADGIVGIVMRSGRFFSDVLLITDPNSNLDVIVARNRRRGILSGNTVGNMLFKYSDRGSRVQVGDEIVSSGLTGPFPSGIAVGKVYRINDDSGIVSQGIEVEPAVHVFQLSEVLVMLNPSREIDIIRKYGGEDWMKKIFEGVETSKFGG